MIKDRVVRIVEYKGLTKETFFKKIGMTSASFRGKAKNTPLNSIAIENIISEIRDLNIEWLITGEGEMIKDGNKQSVQNINLTKITPHSDSKLDTHSKKSAGLLHILKEEGMENTSKAAVFQLIDDIGKLSSANLHLAESSRLLTEEVIKIRREEEDGKTAT